MNIDNKTLMDGIEYSILGEAWKIVGPKCNRGLVYSEFEQNLVNIAGLWSIILKTKITEEQVCLCMVALKLARLINTIEHKDSQVDVCGYMVGLERILKWKKSRDNKKCDTDPDYVYDKIVELLEKEITQGAD